MKAIATTLDPLSIEARARVIAWAASFYGVRAYSAAKLPAARGAQEGSLTGSVDAMPSFDNVAEFFDAADPQTESDKALVVGYWLQRHESLSTFESAAVNRELKHLGHAIKNITSAFEDLIEQKPSLAVQTAKSGKSRQARKKYMITKTGEKVVLRMVLGEGADN